MVAGKKKVVAVIDDHIEHRVLIGAATSSGLSGALVQHYPRSALAHPHRSSESGKAGADHVDRAHAIR